MYLFLLKRKAEAQITVFIYFWLKKGRKACLVLRIEELKNTYLFLPEPGLYFCWKVSYLFQKIFKNCILYYIKTRINTINIK